MGSESEMRLPQARPTGPDAAPRRLTLKLSDGYETGLYRYAPPGGPAGLPVLVLHGIQSHPGWFTGSCAEMARRGREVYAVTRRGSGESGRARGHAASAGVLLGDVDEAARFVLDATGAERLHMVGISWGGKLAVAYAAHEQRSVSVASLVLVAPGIAARVGMSLVGKLGVALALLIAPNRRFDIPLDEPALFTDNERMREYLRSDGARLHRATARFLYASRELDRFLRRRPRGTVQSETTLLLAERDRIVHNDRTRRAVERLTGMRAAVVELSGAHTLEFEEDPTPLYEALAAGLQRGEAGQAPSDGAE
jgi:alpha-beta hydrolase superfamily lysophospholipase